MERPLVRPENIGPPPNNTHEQKFDLPAKLKAAFSKIEKGGEI